MVKFQVLVLNSALLKDGVSNYCIGYLKKTDYIVLILVVAPTV